MLKVTLANGTVIEASTVEELAQIQAILASAIPSKPSRSTGSKATEPKELAHYDTFTFDGKWYTVVSKASKGGNPDALLVVSFPEKPSKRTCNYLKGCGFKYNGVDHTWYNKNTGESQACVKNILK